ncbi:MULTISPECIES: type I methionyl aminopeptidase [Acinetobacter]|uniref:Methionine aminopeptidase n=1 Tax=Acinetobacter ursingii TaxID=108980 RepID=A0A3G9FW40_9GAMM|nr:MULTISPECIES: type I methionyl aminopeptidase [Acinetobacter]ENX48879.1 methionine aminopeptidase, type I [Acinetobacter ursingii NIPH 706]EXD38020.1 methionine aminopeptidase, type I [Acinetobacter sp. 479375]MCH2003809.1 type I methionyl aminopeptidase [Acinetobacter ursingii]MCH2014584.1 type I methionyl aminopeptidase [Acinetobacter ursingii]MCU4357571.1 type I methionyl aminopeptidase [Acinetobacter ursingii]
MRASTVTIKTEQDIENLRVSGRLAAQVLEMIADHIKPGVSTEYLDDICHDYIVNTLQVIPANVGYHGFTKTTCTSVNEVVCHGIPSPAKILQDGDIINIDVAIIKDGYFGDTSRMFLVGDVHPDAKKLVETTYKAMYAGIQSVKPGATLGDIGYAIQSVAQAQGYSIVREYCGHGIGKVYHEQPNILHYGQPGQGMVLQKGMVFTIEPMVNAGHAQVKELSDGWTVITKDKSLSAQWEHMVAVTETGYELLTPWPNGTGSYPDIEVLPVTATE